MMRQMPDRQKAFEAQGEQIAPSKPHRWSVVSMMQVSPRQQPLHVSEHDNGERGQGGKEGAPRRRPGEEARGGIDA